MVVGMVRLLILSGLERPARCNHEFCILKSGHECLVNWQFAICSKSLGDIAVIAIRRQRISIFCTVFLSFAFPNIIGAFAATVSRHLEIVDGNSLLSTS